MNHFKKLIIAAALAGLSGAALADSASTTVNIGGEIGVSCAASAETLNVGQTTTYLLRYGIPVTVNLSVTCSNGSTYSISQNGSAGAVINGKPINLDAASPLINGVNFDNPHVDTGTGLPQAFSVTGLEVSALNSMTPTAGLVAGTFSGFFTISY